MTYSIIMYYQLSDTYLLALAIYQYAILIANVFKLKLLLHFSFPISPGSLQPPSAALGPISINTTNNSLWCFRAFQEFLCLILCVFAFRLQLTLYPTSFTK